MSETCDRCNACDYLEESIKETKGEFYQQRIKFIEILVEMYNFDKTEISKNKKLVAEIIDIRKEFFFVSSREERRRTGKKTFYLSRIGYSALDRLIESEFDGCSAKEFFDRYCKLVRESNPGIKIERKEIYNIGWLELYNEKDILDLDSD